MNNICSEYPWLNEALFERILQREWANGNIRVIDLVVKSALGKGENYTSQMLRVRVNCQDGLRTRSAAFIVKAPLNNGMNDVIAELGLFRKEIENYEKVLPAVQAILLSIGDEPLISGKCFETNNELSYLVFEDLSEKGYANLNRQSGLSVHDFRLVLTKTAKWHAATAVLYERTPSLFEPFMKQNFSRDSKPWQAIAENASQAVSDACKFLPEFQHLSGKISAGQSTVFERFCLSAARNPNSFNVLTHGDLWSNNIMFQHDKKTGNTTDAILVDFQLSSFQSPMLDIIYSFFSSSNEQITEVYWEELLQFYHHELTQCLRKLGFAGRQPRLLELHQELLTRGIFGAILGMFVLAVRNLKDAEGADMLRFLSDKPEDREYRKELMLKPECRKGLEFLLRYCDRKGILDV